MASLVNADITEIRRASAGLAGVGFLPGVVGVALLGAAAAIGLAAGAWERFVHAYLLGVMYVTSLGVGGLFFVLAHHLTGGRWGTTVRRLAEITAGTLAVSFGLYLLILVFGVLAGSDALYPWVDRAWVESDPILRSKMHYLDPKWFTLRACVYYLLWIGMAWTMLGISTRQDAADPLRRAKAMQWWAGPMMLLYALSMNFASFDFMMSLEPHWFSTMFGVYFFAGSFGGFLAWTILLCTFLQARGVLTQSVTTEHYHDMAKLLFAFVVFWGYIAFSQYMLIWYAAIPEETLWFDIRQQGIWPYWGLALAAGRIFVPFLGFMSRAVRRSKNLMFFWACWMLAMHWVDLAYIILPQAGGGGSEAPTIVMGLLATAGALGVFLWAWMSGAAGKWLLPVQDPRLPIALSYHNH